MTADRGVHGTESSSLSCVCANMCVSAVLQSAQEKPCLFFQSLHSTTDTAVSAIICLCLQQIKLSAAFSAQPNLKKTLDFVYICAREYKTYCRRIKYLVFKEVLLLLCETLFEKFNIYFSNVVKSKFTIVHNKIVI